MSSRAESETSSRLDSAKLSVAAGVAVLGVVAFYYFAEQSLLLRVLGLLVVVAISIAIAMTSERGRETWRFMKEARAELRKVDWPSRAETVQTTLAVFAMVIVLGLALWLLDMFLFWLVRLLTGQGG
jgi:preprotein translocase subunit SecE